MDQGPVEALAATVEEMHDALGSLFKLKDEIFMLNILPSNALARLTILSSRLARGRDTLRARAVVSADALRGLVTGAQRDAQLLELRTRAAQLESELAAESTARRKAALELDATKRQLVGARDARTRERLRAMGALLRAGTAADRAAKELGAARQQLQAVVAARDDAEARAREYRISQRGGARSISSAHAHGRGVLAAARAGGVDGAVAQSAAADDEGVRADDIPAAGARRVVRAARVGGARASTARARRPSSPSSYCAETCGVAPAAKPTAASSEDDWHEDGHEPKEFTRGEMLELALVHSKQIDFLKQSHDKRVAALEDRLLLALGATRPPAQRRNPAALAGGTLAHVHQTGRMFITSQLLWDERRAEIAAERERAYGPRADAGGAAAPVTPSAPPPPPPPPPPPRPPATPPATPPAAGRTARLAEWVAGATAVPRPREGAAGSAERLRLPGSARIAQLNGGGGRSLGRVAGAAAAAAAAADAAVRVGPPLVGGAASGAPRRDPSGPRGDVGVTLGDDSGGGGGGDDDDSGALALGARIMLSPGAFASTVHHQPGRGRVTAV
ncbi:hypothetical protein KFE25_014227 [Diacronema lutheri]|uniref:Uncharacterized protein n=1 Tax=Diacronema lutheri TaxID=2081491 RepID=A0A8J5XFT2_DIALT|nr:hypothetical protein KFE25_014227 [Diacronema lutheri]